MISNKCAKEPASNETSTVKSTAAHKNQMGAQASGKASTVKSASGKAKRLQSINAATDKANLEPQASLLHLARTLLDKEKSCLFTN